jgi:hypothetical protein
VLACSIAIDVRASESVADCDAIKVALTGRDAVSVALSGWNAFTDGYTLPHDNHNFTRCDRHEQLHFCSLD